MWLRGWLVAGTSVALAAGGAPAGAVVTTQARIVIASVPAGGRILTAARSPIIVIGSIALVTLALLPTRTNPRLTTPPPGTASTPEDVEPGATGAGRSDWRDPP